MPELERIEKCRNVLTCYAKRNPDIGYCQGLNFIVWELSRHNFTEEVTNFIYHKASKPYFFFQETFWFFTTLLENILLPFLPRHDKQARSDARERAIHLIEKLSLSTKMNQYPTQLSVGECQRTALLRAIITQPRLLLADEPTGSLDAVNAVQLAQLLSTLSLEYNMAMVVVTHSMELASQMDKIYQLREGKLTLLNTSAT